MPGPVDSSRPAVRLHRRPERRRQAMVIDAMDLLYSGRFRPVLPGFHRQRFTCPATRVRESGLTVYGVRRTQDAAHRGVRQVHLYRKSHRPSDHPGRRGPQLRFARPRRREARGDLRPGQAPPRTGPARLLFWPAAVIPVSVRTLSPCHVHITVVKSPLALDRPGAVTCCQAGKRLPKAEPETGIRCRDERHLFPGGSGKRLLQLGQVEDLRWRRLHSSR